MARKKSFLKKDKIRLVIGLFVIGVASFIVLFVYKYSEAKKLQDSAFTSCNQLDETKEFILRSFSEKYKTQYDTRYEYTKNPIISIQLDPQEPQLGFSATNGAHYAIFASLDEIDKHIKDKIEPSISNKGFIYDLENSSEDYSIHKNFYRRGDEFVVLRFSESEGQKLLALFCGSIDLKLLLRYRELLKQEIVLEQIEKIEAFKDENGNKTSRKNIRFEIWEDYGTIIHVNIGTFTGAGYWFAQSSAGTWNLISVTQERPLCSVLEHNNAPKGIDCVDEFKDSVTK